MELDVADPKSIQNLYKAVIEQYRNPPKIIVNSAGITRDNWLLKMSEDDYDNVLNVNLKVTLLLLSCYEILYYFLNNIFIFSEISIYTKLFE